MVNGFVLKRKYEYILLFPSHFVHLFLTPVPNILMWKFVHILHFVVSNFEVPLCFLSIIIVFVALS
jgi:hypothetical protein